MIRKIIKINEDKCNGCGICANACHENAIKVINGVAKLTRDDYCDGLGDCIPSCPKDAITFIEVETVPYNESEVKKNQAKNSPNSNLNQWPVQLKLLPIRSQMYDNADLLISADCVSYAFADFHKIFLKGKVCLIGCPKLDNEDYSLKLFDIIKNNNIRSISVVKMEVLCCIGIELAVRKALNKSQKDIFLNVVTITTDGKIK